jgi:hypothetical protein
MATWYVSSAKHSAVTQWAALTAKSVGNFVRQLAAPTAGNERVWRCTTAWTMTERTLSSDAGAWGAIGVDTHGLDACMLASAEKNIWREGAFAIYARTGTGHPVMFERLGYTTAPDVFWKVCSPHSLDA